MWSRNTARQLTYGLNRKDNPLVLSETLDETAIQTLLGLSLADRYPEQCNEWHDVKENISDLISRERTKRQHILFEELDSKQRELRRVLRNAVVKEVMELYPCVLLFVSAPSHRMLRPHALTSRSLERDGLSPYDSQAHRDASEVASENLKSLTAFGVVHYVHQTRCRSQILGHLVLIFRKSFETISGAPGLTPC